MSNEVEQVTISDCVLRDGLQIVQQQVALEDKKRILQLLIDSGLTDIEITSMVPPKLIPQFGDSEGMIAFANELEIALPTVLVPNLKGAERAIEAGAKSLVVPLSVSETHSMKNLRKSRSDQVLELGKIRDLINQQPENDRPFLAAGLSTAFGCSYEGRIDENDVMKLAHQCHEIGADEVSLADTVGYATPDQVKRIFSRYFQEFGTDIPMRAHFHDTFGMGLVNAYAALEAGVRIFDASLCGLGGCPFAPNSAGNITLEDLVYMMQKLGLKTGIDMDILLQGQALLKEILPEQPLYGVINRAGNYPADFTPEKGLTSTTGMLKN